MAQIQWYYTQSPFPLWYGYIPALQGVYAVVVIQAGSVYDTLPYQGLAHLVEHLLFKGSRSYSAKRLMQLIEAYGGDMNAYTTKEHSYFYFQVPATAIHKALSALKSMLFEATLAPNAIEQEKQVILEELALYEEMPDELIHERFEALLFPQHPLGTPILGTTQSLRAITPEVVEHFYQHYYLTPHLAMAVVAPFPWQRFRTLFQNHFSMVTLKPKDYKVPPPVSLNHQQMDMEVQQAHYLIGSYAPAAYTKESLVLSLFLNYLAGDAMSSYLLWELREKRALVYQVSANMTFLRHVGWWNLYTTSKPKNLPKIRRIIRQALEIGYYRLPLEQIKKQAIGQLQLKWDKLDFHLFRRAERSLYQLPIPDLTTTIRQIQQLTLKDFQAVLEKYVLNGNLCEIESLP